MSLDPCNMDVCYADPIAHRPLIRTETDTESK